MVQLRQFWNRGEPLNWYRAKTILIILFTLVNIFLGFILITDKLSNNNKLENTLSEILIANNIELDISKVPIIKSTILVPEFLNIQSYDKLINSLIASPIKENDNSYTDNGNTKKLTISNNIIYFSDTSYNEEFKGVSKNNVVSKLTPILKKLQIYKYVYPTNIIESNGNFQVDFGYTINKYTLFKNNISFFVSNNGINKIEGAINIPNSTNGYTYDLVNIETVLLNFIKNNKASTQIKISTIRFGYYFPTYEEAISTQAIPVYQIITDNKAYLYDARAGINNADMQINFN